MKPFDVSNKDYISNKYYLDFSTFKHIIKHLSYQDLPLIFHQWLSEGIPIIFSEYPLLYEQIRYYLADNLNIHPKEITLIGSARTGFSLSTNKFGKPFDINSDLDFTIISEYLFNKCMIVFEKWKNDYCSNIVYPLNKNQKYYWDHNIKELPGTIKRGFLDTNKIPNLYPDISQINNRLWVLKKKLELTLREFTVKKISIRIYKNWGYFTEQFLLNLSKVQKYIVYYDN
ncbi:MAG: hypothetical protein AB1521_12620 [Bacteroidota bacterium]